MSFVRKCGISVAGCALAMGVTLVSVPAPAQASTSDCDNSSVDHFSEVGGGSSFTNQGRRILLLNGNLFNHSLARFSSGRRDGDRIWADRSINAMPKEPVHPSTAAVQANGGWKQCGPFSGVSSDQVMNWNTDTQRHFAVRACFDPVDGDAYCGAWYVDAS